MSRQDYVGMLAISRAGHDRDEVYVIVGEEGEYIWLADGRCRSISKPKKKKKKHIQLIKYFSKIRQVLKSYRKSLQKKQ